MNNALDKRLKRARLSLTGLSIGDSLGTRLELMLPEKATELIANRKLPEANIWRFTDDTNMTLSVYENLRRYQRIKQDELAASFVAHFSRDRAYGMGTRRLMARILDGEPWREASNGLFPGGSYGNGGAMRVAVVGAYFADDLDAVIKNAALSAEITHAHPEGIVGAMAVAVAAAYAWRYRNADKPARQDFIEAVIQHLPDSEVRKNCEIARTLPDGLPIGDVVATIGNGMRVTAQDSVPFVLYCVGEYMDNYENAIWKTASGGGDVDTTCAMVGGIVALFAGEDSIPQTWQERREPLPAWAFKDDDSG